MSKLDKYYESYMNYCNTLYDDESVQKGSLFTDNKNKETNFIEKYDINIQIDTKWLDKFEECFPYVENCIRAMRTFLFKEEEITPIEQANKVDIQQSIQYLCQHTDLILEVDEEKSTITPSKIINNFYESTHNIYENLFIYSLVKKCEKFISDCYNTLERTRNFNYFKLEHFLKQKSKAFSSDLKLDVSLNYQKLKKEIVKQNDRTFLGRLEKLNSKENEFLDTYFIKFFKNATLVKSPLTMTNVLLKNPDFIKAVELWDFIEKYDGEKITITKAKKVVELNEEEIKNVHELNSIINFVTRIYFDRTFKNILNKNYRLLKKNELRQNALIEKARQKEIRNKILQAKEEQKSIDEIKYKDKINKYELKIKQIIQERNKKYQILKEEYLANIEKKIDFYNKKISKTNWLYEKKIRNNLLQYNKKIERLNQNNINEKASIEKRHNRECQKLIKDNELKLYNFNLEKESEIKRITEELNQQIINIKLEKESEIKKMTEDYQFEINRNKLEYQANLDSIEENHKKELNEEKEKNLNTVTYLKEENEKNIEDLNKTYQSQILKINNINTNNINTLTHQYEKKIKISNDEYNKIKIKNEIITKKIKEKEYKAFTKNEEIINNKVTSQVEKLTFELKEKNKVLSLELKLDDEIVSIYKYLSKNNFLDLNELKKKYIGNTKFYNLLKEELKKHFKINKGKIYKNR